MMEEKIENRAVAGGLKGKGGFKKRKEASEEEVGKFS